MQAGPDKACFGYEDKVSGGMLGLRLIKRRWLVKGGLFGPAPCRHSPCCIHAYGLYDEVLRREFRG
jgi:hypothetical protein